MRGRRDIEAVEEWKKGRDEWMGEMKGQEEKKKWKVKVEEWNTGIEGKKEGMRGWTKKESIAEVKKAVLLRPVEQAFYTALPYIDPG